jgi:hypothetical protein
LGSDAVNTVTWTAETLNTAFAKYPLLPENSPAMQVFGGLALSATGLDTVTDFAALISGRDPLTGDQLAPREMFITWLAFSIPFIGAGALRSFADDAAMLFKTGIWGGTIRDIAAALPPDVTIGVRPRPVAAGLWELTRLTSPKPVKTAAGELAKLKWGSLDTGLRLMEDHTGQRWFKLFLAHSDIDLQFIVQNGGPVSAQMVDEFVAGVNSRLGRELFQHGDNFTGLTQWALGPTKAYQDAPTVIIGKPGYLGMGPGLNGFLGYLNDEWRKAVLVYFSIPGVP